MPKISAVIITLNEEKNIRRCLESVRDVADETVVVDSFSTDRTGEICREYGARFITHPFEGHIEQKNYAITRASHPHILSIDADESFSEELKRSILKVKEDWQYDGYYFNRLTNYCGKWIRHCGWYPDRKLRLWDSRKGCWGGQNPHDKFIMQPGTRQQYIPGDLLHHSFYTIGQHVEQINKFSTIKAEGLFRNNKKCRGLKMIFSPLVKFIKGYFIQLGFLDGVYGYIICRNSAHSTFLKYAKLRMMHKDNTAG